MSVASFHQRLYLNNCLLSRTQLCVLSKSVLMAKRDHKMDSYSVFVVVVCFLEELTGDPVLHTVKQKQQRVRVFFFLVSYPHITNQNFSSRKFSVCRTSSILRPLTDPFKGQN